MDLLLCIQVAQRSKVAIDRQKSYTDMKRKDIRYEFGEKVFLKYCLGRR